MRDVSRLASSEALYAAAVRAGGRGKTLTPRERG